MAPRWVKFRDWSGISIRGTNRYQKNPPAGEWEVVMAAIAKPEGGAFDTVVSYDGTALTWGIAQWTFTSGRLQKLLAKIISAFGHTSGYSVLIQRALQSYNLRLDSIRGVLRSLDSLGKDVTSKSDLRNIFTPPGGKLPRKGPNWEKAKAFCLVFSELGQDPGIARVQRDFLVDELERESTLSRPKLGGRSIKKFLYDSPNSSVSDELIAARALFWSMWQNSPRYAEIHMSRVWPKPVVIDQKQLKRFSSIFAKSTFGNWGNAKAKSNRRESRYHKTAVEINRVMGIPDILDPDIS